MEFEDKEVKKALYIMLWAILGALFAICLAGLVEFMSYQIVGALDAEVVLFGTMIFVGIVFGLFCGVIGWQKVYVKGLRGRRFIFKK